MEDKQFYKGFTLVELLVVMAILGILAVITLANFSTSQAKARDAQRKSDLKQISIALEAYYADHGAYPVSGTSGDAGKIMSCGCATPTACAWGGSSDREFCDTSNTVYMKEIPDDTVSGRHYCYYSGGSFWRLYAILENTRDLDKLPSTVKCYNASADFDYGIASTNTTLKNYDQPK